jgi:hypothetical protein
MAYRVIYETKADKIRRGLPIGARLALAARMRQIANDPYKHSRPYSGSTTRSATFSARGIVVFRVQQEVILVTVVDATWSG